MNLKLRNGRIVGPMHPIKAGGKRINIPRGPCLLEHIDDGSVDLIWGENGQQSAVLSRTALEAAVASGNLLLLDATD